jgi:hypothetical protein
VIQLANRARGLPKNLHETGAIAKQVDMAGNVLLRPRSPDTGLTVKVLQAQIRLLYHCRQVGALFKNLSVTRYLD